MNVMHSHVRANVKPMVAHIEPYVFLSEELMSRTSDGWKKAPLDELKTLVDEVKEDSVTDLRNILARLLDLRAQKRLEAIDETMENRSPDLDFRDLTIIPPKELIFSGGDSHRLPVNQIGAPYRNVGEYLGTHFRLMQEDYIATLRDGIRELRQNSKSDSNIHVYTNVCLESIQCGRDGIVSRVSFTPKTNRPIDWQSNKRLKFGSLLCMSCDKFQTLVWAVVANRTVEELNKRRVDIQILDSSEEKALQPGEVYVMAETSLAAYFEAYSHVLRNLQRPEMDKLPFQEHFIALKPHVKEPAYLREGNRKDLFDFRCVLAQMECDERDTQFHIMQTWPEWQSSLDKSQMTALKHGLTRRLALIQGPPGTGKTFIGVLMVRIMLANLKHVPSSRPPGPPHHSKHVPSSRRPGPPRNRTQTNMVANTKHVPSSPLPGPPHNRTQANMVANSKHVPSSPLPGPPHNRTQTNMVANPKHVPFPRLPGPPPNRPQTNQQEDIMGGPILVICYTNHALDQFLEGIYAHEKSIVRIGGRSRSTQLEGCNLQNLMRQERHGSTHLLQDEKNRLEEQNDLKKQILDFAHLEKVEYVTEDMLEGIATSKQVNSLFYKGCNIKTVVQRWLNDEQDNINLIQPNQFQMQNQFDILEIETVSDAVSESSEDTETENVEYDKDEHEDVWISAVKTLTKPLITDHGTFMDTMRDARNPNIMCSDKFGSKLHENDMRTTEACEPAGFGWTMIKPRSTVPNLKLSNCSTNETMSQKKELALNKLQQCSDVWSLGSKDRRALHTFWVNTIQKEAREKLSGLYAQYTEICRAKQEIEDEMKLFLLRKAKLVGMTTTGAARHYSVLESLQAKIIVVQEAAEVLESHIVACLTPSTKHLVLIGDHLQLRPGVAVYNLAVEHKLDVSLFERLVESGVEYATLNVQRRMTPSISRLISVIYPKLEDHESVSKQEKIKGMKSNVFFLHHTAPEEHHGDDDLGKVNKVEAQLAVELCAYLLKQQYSYSDVTILSMYRGQTQEIRKRLAQKLQSNQCNDGLNLPRVRTVDEFQGEECKIIILSTAGAPGKIGFLAESNRMCVALSRAQDGLFMFGNGDLLSEKSGQWKDVIEILQSDAYESDAYGDALVLKCQNHPDRETKIQKPSDFHNVSDGGCDKACEHQLNCGHACPKRCHPGQHEKIVCPKRCPRKYIPCGHQCQSLCHGFSDCAPCTEKVSKTLPECGHSANVSCSTSIGSVVCQMPCPKVFSCSHVCPRKCGEQCAVECYEKMDRALPCNHLEKLACYIDPSTYCCQRPCLQILPQCKHSCQGTCGTCKQGQAHIPCRQKCNKSLPCGHPCASDFHEVCSPCSLPCQKRCPHSRCPNQCGYPCIPCMEPCLWRCRHDACKLLCHELCVRPCCNEPCEKSLQCGHPCLGFCGEPCPNICRLCTPDYKDTICLMTMGKFEESDRFVKLQDCDHVFEVSWLDTWMNTEQAESGTNDISPKKCPECQTPIIRSFRYGNQVKAKLKQIEEEKARNFH